MNIGDAARLSTLARLQSDVVIAALVVLGLLLYFPALRRSVGAFAWGVLFLIAMTLGFGEAGALTALAVGLAAFVGGFNRR